MFERFTDNQIFDMMESASTLDVIDSATSSHIPEPDFSSDLAPQTASLDEVMAKHRLASRKQNVHLPNGMLHVNLCRSFDQTAAERFGARWQHPKWQKTHGPHGRLNVKGTGFVTVGFQNTGVEREYSTYRIEQPDGVLHELGIIVVSTVFYRSEVISPRKPAESDAISQLQRPTDEHRILDAAAARRLRNIIQVSLWYGDEES